MWEPLDPVVHSRLTGEKYLNCILRRKQALSRQIVNYIRAELGVGGEAAQAGGTAYSEKRNFNLPRVVSEF